LAISQIPPANLTRTTIAPHHPPRSRLSGSSASVTSDNPLTLNSDVDGAFARFSHTICRCPWKPSLHSMVIRIRGTESGSSTTVLHKIRIGCRIALTIQNRPHDNRNSDQPGHPLIKDFSPPAAYPWSPDASQTITRRFLAQGPETHTLPNSQLCTLPVALSSRGPIDAQSLAGLSASLLNRAHIAVPSSKWRIRVRAGIGLGLSNAHPVALNGVVKLFQLRR